LSLSLDLQHLIDHKKQGVDDQVHAVIIARFGKLRIIYFQKTEDGFGFIHKHRFYVDGPRVGVVHHLPELATEHAQGHAPCEEHNQPNVVRNPLHGLRNSRAMDLLSNRGFLETLASQQIRLLLKTRRTVLRPKAFFSGYRDYPRRGFFGDDLSMVSKA